MIFSTSAGQVVFNSYKDRTPLPEDVARANGHEDLAQYLQDVNIRYMSVFCRVSLINWFVYPLCSLYDIPCMGKKAFLRLVSSFCIKCMVGTLKKMLFS